MVTKREFNLTLQIQFGDLSEKELKTLLSNAFMDKLKTEGIKIMYELKEVTEKQNG